MENYEAFVGFDLCKIPLSSVAQKIMSAMHSGDLVESENWRESEKSDQPSGVSIKFCPQSSSIRVTDQLSAEQNQKGISSSAPSRCSVPQCDQQASVLQQMERKRKHLPKEHITNENNRESMNLTGKYISCNHSSAKASKLVILEEDAGEVETYLNSRNSQALKTDFCDIRHLDALEKSQLIEMLKQAATVVVTLMYKDGSTQLRADQALVSSVKGIVMLLSSYPEEDSGPLAAPASDSFPEDMPSDQCIYIKTEHSSLWGQEQEAHQQFAKNVLREVLERKRPVTCFNAKDFVRTVLQFFGDDGSWKCVADFVGLDPRIAAWLIDPSDAAPSFEDLVAKYLGNPTTLTVNSVDGNSSRKTVVICLSRPPLSLGTTVCRSKGFQSNMMSFLPLKQACGLWQLFWTLELPLIPILAVMETHRIRVNKEEMERTSALLELRQTTLTCFPKLQLREMLLCPWNSPCRSIRVRVFIHPLPHEPPSHLPPQYCLLMNKIFSFHKITLTSIDILIYCLPIQEHEMFFIILSNGFFCIILNDHLTPPFILLMWHITLINFCMLNHPYILGINSTWSCGIFKSPTMTVEYPFLPSDVLSGQLLTPVRVMFRSSESWDRSPRDVACAGGSRPPNVGLAQLASDCQLKHCFQKDLLVTDDSEAPGCNLFLHLDFKLQELVMDREVWRAVVHGVVAQIRDFTCLVRSVPRARWPRTSPCWGCVSGGTREGRSRPLGLHPSRGSWPDLFCVQAPAGVRECDSPLCGAAFLRRGLRHCPVFQVHGRVEQKVSTVAASRSVCPGAGGEVGARQTGAQSILRTEGSVCKLFSCALIPRGTASLRSRSAGLQAGGTPPRAEPAQRPPVSALLLRPCGRRRLCAQSPSNRQ
ncbi:hypothetical protein FD755_022870 [Muntiacus reevesi]|uniref:DNA polymerase nu pseudo-exo domain-containing protein n=1 Tax=Muntiacus reevesi TaxID=9886 RepID=A0A5N3W118_MUNRE|nr:hypothetical protein FD755_022870 [Muntiacus reevesi]